MLKYDANFDYDVVCEKEANKVLKRKDEFIDRGLLVVKGENKDIWRNFIESSLSEKNEFNRIWYNGAKIEAAILCMELLSSGSTLEVAYKPIDVYDSDNPCVHCDMMLTGPQSYEATSIIGVFHERGLEFCKYYDALIKFNKEVKGGKRR